MILRKRSYYPSALTLDSICVGIMFSSAIRIVTEMDFWILTMVMTVMLALDHGLQIISLVLISKEKMNANGEDSCLL